MNTATFRAQGTTGPSQNDPAPSPEHLSVWEEVSNLRLQVNQLQDLMKVTRERLVPVLSEEGPVAESFVAGSSNQPSCPLAAELRGVKSSLEVAVCIAHEILRRLQV